MIAAIEIPKGYSSPKLRSVVTAKTGRHYLIFDPTWEKTPFGQIEHDLQGSYGVLMEGTDSQIVAASRPRSGPQYHSSHRRLPACSRRLSQGHCHREALRRPLRRSPRLYTRGDAKEQTQFLDHVLGQDFTTFSVADFKVENVDALNKDLTTSLLAYRRPLRQGHGPAAHGSPPRPRQRRAGYRSQGAARPHQPVTRPCRSKDDYTIELPAGYTVDEVPDPVKSISASPPTRAPAASRTTSSTTPAPTPSVKVTLPADRYGDVQKLAGSSRPTSRAVPSSRSSSLHAPPLQDSRRKRKDLNEPHVRPSSSLSFRSSPSCSLWPHRSARADDTWTTPTPEELSMTSQPEVPGACRSLPLSRRETEDDLHMFSVYARLKVLTEAGKDQGNVELKYAKCCDRRRRLQRYEIQGRTIHPDGTIIPFTGKPYQKLIEKTRGVKVMAKVFSMPDVEVGSIIEYRYNSVTTTSTSFLLAGTSSPISIPAKPTTSGSRPSMTCPTTRMINTIAWFPILPAGAKLQQTQLPPKALARPEDLRAQRARHHSRTHEDYMPPTSSLTYRVLFYYSTYRNSTSSGRTKARYGARRAISLSAPATPSTAAVQQLVLPGDTQDQKLRKIYAAVMQTRKHGLHAASSTSAQKRRRRAQGDPQHR